MNPNDSSKRRRLLMLALAALTSSLRLAGGQPNATCDSEREFTCAFERRCVPLEAKCDFREQCADGQDELGCAPERCNFEQDFCNWRNDFVPLDASEPRAGRLIWRRHCVGQEQQARDSPPGTRAPAALLARLTGEHPTGARLLTVGQRVDQRELEVRAARGRDQLGAWTRSALGSASLLAPTIGRTDSMCQLRFRYALGLAGRRALAAASSRLNRRLKVELSLSLWASRAGGGSRSRLWHKRVALDSRAPAELEVAAGGWAVGVLELGRLAHTQLSFEAATTLAVSTNECRSRARAGALETLAQISPDASSMGARASDYGQIGGLAALDWLEFRRCNWPPESHQSPSLVLDDQSDFNERSVDSSGPTPPPAAADRWACAPAEYQCTNSVCLSERRLCNFVDDCMSGGRATEDESRQLCAAVPGMEDFESGWLGAGNSSHFWSLVGAGWLSQVALRDNQKQETHLPGRDHTRRDPRAHFLSFAVPPATGDRVHAAYLKSPWLRKLDAKSGECRLKFFFNLVTGEPPTGASAATHRDPFKLYLAVDHFVVDSSSQSPANASRRVDSILLTHTVDYERLVLDGELGSIEYPGVDFWREVNVNLVDLREGDTFQVRIAIIVELSGQSADRRASTINIDDLSTHFGCGLARDADTDSPAARALESRLATPLNLSEFLRAPLLLPPGTRTRGRRNAHANEVDPQTLITYVFGVLALILGAIAGIVFIVVPYVERATMNYQDRVALELSGAQDVPSVYASTGPSQTAETREFASGSDWERVSRAGRSRFLSSDGGERRNSGSQASASLQFHSLASEGSDSIGSTRNLNLEHSDESTETTSPEAASYNPNDSHRNFLPSDDN